MSCCFLFTEGINSITFAKLNQNYSWMKNDHWLTSKMPSETLYIRTGIKADVRGNMNQPPKPIMHFFHWKYLEQGLFWLSLGDIGKFAFLSLKESQREQVFLGS